MAELDSSYSSFVHIFWNVLSENKTYPHIHSAGLHSVAETICILIVSANPVSSFHVLIKPLECGRVT